jgi:hypothetical protein
VSIATDLGDNLDLGRRSSNGHFVRLAGTEHPDIDDVLDDQVTVRLRDTDAGQARILFTRPEQENVASLIGGDDFTDNGVLVRVSVVESRVGVAVVTTGDADVVVTQVDNLTVVAGDIEVVAIVIVVATRGGGELTEIV